jgi:hypothetical protein
VLFEPSPGRCLLSLHLGTGNLPGQVGRIRIEVEEEDVATPIASFQLAAHGDNHLWSTFDLVFMPAPTLGTLWVRMNFGTGTGLEFVGFVSLTLTPLAPIVHP